MEYAVLRQRLRFNWGPKGAIEKYYTVSVVVIEGESPFTADTHGKVARDGN